MKFRDLSSSYDWAAPLVWTLKLLTKGGGNFFCHFGQFFFLLNREREKKALIYCSTYGNIHWLILVCALTGN